MSKTILIFIVFIAVSACNKKDNSLSPDQIKNLRLKTITGVDGSAAQGYSSNLTYDASGRIIKEEENGQTTTYTYSPGKITRKMSLGNQTIGVFELELNADGYVRSSKKAGEPAVYTYEYVTAGFLSKYYDNQVPQYEARYYYNSTHTDLLDSIRSTVGGVWNSTSTFVYDMGHHNTLQNENLGQKYSGAIHPRPFIKYTYKYNDAGSIKIQVTDYVVTYDANGRIIRKSFVNAGQTLAYTYTYY
jgi:hypothetical protein